MPQQTNIEICSVSFLQQEVGMQFLLCLRLFVRLARLQTGFRLKTFSFLMRHLYECTLFRLCSVLNEHLRLAKLYSNYDLV